MSGESDDLGGTDDLRDRALADVAHLARSQNRVVLLTELDRGPTSRRELEETTGIPRATVGRTLAEFEDRGWAERRSDGTYVATPTGEQVRAAFTPLVETIAAINALGDAVAWLPTDEVPIDLRQFRDVTVRQPEQADPLALATYATELLETATDFTCLVGVAPPLAFERLLRDRVAAGDLTTTHVITAGELDYLRAFPARLDRWREYVAAGGDVYRYDGEIPCSILVFDDTVLVGRSPSGGDEPGGFVESDDEEIRSWAHDVVERYRTKAEPLGPEAFDPPDEGAGI